VHFAIFRSVTSVFFLEKFQHKMPVVCGQIVKYYRQQITVVATASADVASSKIAATCAV